MDHSQPLRFINALNQAFHTLMEQDERIIFLGEDILDPYGGAFKASKGLSTKFPNRVLPTPISEAAIVGIGAGLAMKGFLPIVEIMFGDFLSLAYDQILNGISKFPLMYNGKVICPITIRTPMGGGRGYGPTHSQSLEKFFVGIPNLLVLAPSIFCSLTDFYQSALRDARPKLIIENKLMYADFIKVEAGGRIGDLFVKKNNEEFSSTVLSFVPFTRGDVSIITYGGMVQGALKAAEKLLLEEEVTAEVIVLHQLAPFEVGDVLESVQRTKRALIVEEGTLAYGIGAEISASLYESAFHELKAPISRIGSPNNIVPSAKILETQFIPSEKTIYDAVLQLTNG